jgi:O-antigen ligase
MLLVISQIETKTYLHHIQDILSMFHVKHLLKRVSEIQITELVFYIFVLTVPFQIRTILNPDVSYIDYYFSYHKAIFVYLSDLLFICFTFCCIFIKPRVSLAKYAFLPLILAIISLFHVERLDLWFYGTIKLFQFCFIVAYLKNNRQVIKSLIWIIIASGFIQAGLAILQFHVEHFRTIDIFGSYMPGPDESGAATLNSVSGKLLRAYGTFPHPNVLGGFLAISFGLWLYVSRATIHNLKSYFVSQCGTYILAWGLTVSFSRSGWLAAAILSILFITYQARKSLKQALIWLFIIIVSCGTLGWFYKDLIIPRTNESTPNSAAFEYRETFNNRGLKVFQENPWFGVGINNYVPYTEQKFHVEPWAYQPPHNIFILILAETGIFGLFLLIYWLFRLCFTWNIWKNPYFIGLFVIFLTLGLLDHYLITIQPTYILVAIILAIGVTNLEVSRATSSE